MINESGTITPIFKEPNDLPDCMKTYFKTYRQYSKDIESFEKMTPEEVIEKVSRIFAEGWEQLRERLFAKGIIFDFQRISFTKDNFLKLALIYLRIRVGLPVIVMGNIDILFYVIKQVRLVLERQQLLIILQMFSYMISKSSMCMQE